jgi:hypothetical protein
MSLARRAGGRVMGVRVVFGAAARGPFAAAFVPLAAAAARLRVLLLASATGTPSRGYA